MKYKLYKRKRNNVLNVVETMSAMRRCFGSAEFERIMLYFKQNAKMSMWDWLYGMENTSDNMASVFSRAFGWSMTKQGFQYWYCISERWSLYSLTHNKL
jgi:hypothetical protein